MSGSAVEPIDLYRLPHPKPDNFQIPPFNLDSLLLGIRAHNEVLVAGTVPVTPRPAHLQLELDGLQLRVFCDPCEGLYGTLAYFLRALMIHLEHAVDSHVPALVEILVTCTCRYFQ